MSAISVVRADRSRLPVLLELVAAYYRFDHIDFDRESAERTLGELIDTPALGVPGSRCVATRPSATSC
ncbi:MAG: hypothetical protein ABI867_03020 [Kofleriaceae bacterium]